MDFLELHPGYQKWGKYKIANKLGCTPEQVVEAKALINGKGFKDGDVADSELFKELGFIFEEQVVGKITFKYTKNNFIELHKLYTTILILNNGRTIFEGFIKNKSELIRLLGWLNV